jgi:hypothetical protein
MDRKRARVRVKMTVFMELSPKNKHNIGVLGFMAGIFPGKS